MAQAYRQQLDDFRRTIEALIAAVGEEPVGDALPSTLQSAAASLAQVMTTHAYRSKLNPRLEEGAFVTDNGSGDLSSCGSFSDRVYSAVRQAIDGNRASEETSYGNDLALWQGRSGGPGAGVAVVDDDDPGNPLHSPT